MNYELRAYHKYCDTADVTDRLELIPEEVIHAGEPSVIPELGPIPRNGWFYVGHGDGSHEGGLWWLLAHLQHRKDQLNDLLSAGWDIELLLDQLPDNTMPMVSDTLRQTCNELGISIGISPAYGLIGDS